MKTIMHLLMLSLLTPLLVGCWYVNDSRLYSVRPSFPQDQAQQIAKVLEAQVVQKGLVLKARYHDTYPEEIAVSVFEIPRLPDEKRLNPLFIVYIRSGNVIQLKHSEWWLRASTSNRPGDYIKDIAPELVFAVKTDLGLDVELTIAKEDLSK